MTTPSAECLINESHLGYAAYGAYGIGENIGACHVGNYGFSDLQCHRQMGPRLSHDSGQSSQSAW